MHLFQTKESGVGTFSYTSLSVQLNFVHTQTPLRWQKRTRLYKTMVACWYDVRYPQFLKISLYEIRVLAGDIFVVENGIIISLSSACKKLHGGIQFEII